MEVYRMPDIISNFLQYKNRLEKFLPVIKFLWGKHKKGRIGGNNGVKEGIRGKITGVSTIKCCCRLGRKIFSYYRVMGRIGSKFF